MFCCLFCALAAAQWAAVWRILSRRPARLLRGLLGPHPAGIRPGVRGALLGSAALFTVAVAFGWSSGAFAALDDAVLASRPALRALASWCRGLPLR